VTRYVIIGAGAVGVTFAEGLHRTGAEVLLIARGRQLDALREERLRLIRPDGARTVRLPYAAGPEEAALTEDDVLVLAVKAQDTEQAVADWAWRPVARRDGGQAAAATVLPVVILQNGLESERIALRRFADVLGAVLWVPAVYVDEGVVVSPAAPTAAALWIGRYPAGTDHPVLDRLAADLRAADFAVQIVPDIPAWKRDKLIGNTLNALEALYRPSELRAQVAAQLADEARQVFAAAGLPVADRGQRNELDLSGIVLHDIPGHPHGGMSTWQSLARSGSLEVDYLSGEVVLQARLAGRTAPANAAVTERLWRAAREGTAPGSLGDADLAATVPGLREPVLITPEQLKAELAEEGEHDEGAGERSRPGNPRKPVLLDVRWALGDPDGRAHYREGHIPSAVYVDLDTELAAPATPEAGRHPLPDLAALQRDARRWGITADRPVVVYDAIGGLSAARAWWLLRWAGVADVRILDGSLAGWRAAGGELAAGEETAGAPGDIVLSSGRLPVLTADEAAELPSYGVLLDARAGERYRGEIEPVDSRAGHIPGAVSAPTGENLDAEGTFTDAERNRKRFAALGAADGAVVGVYCGSGVTAAHQIAALAAAGIDAALYPGSWSAWSADPRRPVATGPEPGGNEGGPARAGTPELLGERQ
jgi:thiosulfate/3-mercaptopyruvate sulfurtransferase